MNDGGYEDGARSPLMWACFKGKTHIVKMLLEGGAKVNSQDSYGSTALSFAVNARKGTDTEGEQLDPRTDKPASYHITKLLLEHEAVRDVAVVGIPDEQWGEAVAAAVVLHPGQTVEPSELQAFVTNVEGAYSRAHRLGELRRTQSDRALPENRNSFVTRKIEPL